MSESKGSIKKKSSTVFPYRGKWRVQYFDSKGQIRTKTVASRFEGYQFLVEQNKVLEAERLRLQFGFTWTVRDWFQHALKVSANHLRPTTLERNTRLLEMYLFPRLGHMALEDLRPLHLEQFYRSVASATKLSNSSVWRLRGAILGPLRMAVLEGCLPNHAFNEAKPPSIAKTKKRLLTNSDFALLDISISKLPPLMQLRWRLALEYGLRQGEALGLQWTDFSPEEKTLTIHRTVRNIGSSGLYVSGPKTMAGRRTIPLREETLAILGRITVGTSEWIFRNSEGDPWDPTYDRRQWKKLLLESAVQLVSLHSARHYTATKMITSGADIKSVQALLGHSSASFTLNIYTHSNLESIKAALEKTFS